MSPEQTAMNSAWPPTTQRIALPAMTRTWECFRDLRAAHRAEIGPWALSRRPDGPSESTAVPPVPGRACSLKAPSRSNMCGSIRRILRKGGQGRQREGKWGGEGGGGSLDGWGLERMGGEVPGGARREGGSEKP